MKYFTGRVALVSGLLLLVSTQAFGQGLVCDVDLDGDVDQLDIGMIFAARNTPASGPGDPRDSIPDGFITVNDGAVCVQQCTELGCPIITPSQNTVPVADAGPDQTVIVGATAALDGSASFDADGDALTFAWSFISVPAGSAAALSDPSALMPTFIADTAGEYMIQLVVDDGEDASAPDEVVVITSPGNTAPVADAGPDQTVILGNVVQLDGSGSTDVDLDGLNYFWGFLSLPAGSGATLSDQTSVNPTFVTDLPGEYVLQLVVDDGMAFSGPDTVMITTANTAPVADAGPDQTVTTGSLVTLDGAGSFDADTDPLSYAWSLTTVPPGSAAVLAGGNTANPTFVADLDGTYVAQLIVNDTMASSLPDTVVITSTNTRPVADAGPDQAAFVGDTVVLDGSASFDADGGPLPLSFTWSFNTRPVGSTATLSNPFLVNPSFNADLAGSYVIQLIVNDGLIDSDPDTTLITVQVLPNDPPNITSTPVTAATVDEAYSYDVEATDPDAGDVLTFSLDLAPTGMTIDPVTGLVEWTPTAGQVGLNTVTVRVTDDGNLFATQAYTVDVAANTPPAVDAGPDATIDEGQTFASAGSFTDPDADTWTATVDYGEGAGPQPLPLNPDGSFALGNTYADDGVFTVTVTVTDDDGGAGSDTATVTVNNVPPTVDAGPDDAINEGETFASAGSFTDPGTADTFTATVDYGAGAGPQPLALNPDGTFALSNAYPTTGTFTVTVTVTDDDTGAGSDTATVTVATLPVVTIAATDPDAAEAGPDNGEFTLTRTGDTTGALDVNFTIGGGNLNGVDFQAISSPVQIPAGQPSVVITIVPIDDTDIEGDQPVNLTVVAGTGYVPGTPASATVTIVDDDVPEITIVATDANAAEAGVDTGTFTLTRTGPTDEQLIVTVAASGTATSLADYQNIQAGHVLQVGESSLDITVTPVADNVVETDETLTLTLTASPNYTIGTPGAATVTIADDPAIVTAAATDASAAEAGSDPGTITLTRTGGNLAAALNVQFTFSGAAANGPDFGPLGLGASIPANQASVDVIITPNADNAVEGDEDATLTVTATANYLAGTPVAATVTIADDPVIATITASDPDASEVGPDTGEFTITRSGGNIAQSLPILTVISGTAIETSDYLNIQPNVVILANEISQTLTITPISDSNPEGDETVILTINDTSNYLAGTPATATVTITENAAPSAVDDDTVTTDEETPVDVDVLANDTDPEMDTLTVSGVTQGGNGTVVNNGTDVTYTPDADFEGTDQFSYTIDDGNGNTDSATVTVTVNGTQDAPVATDDDVETDEDVAIDIDVLDNDFDVDAGDTLTIDSVTQPANGAVVNSGTNVTYTPNADFVGTDVFTYTITDGNSGSDTATVTVTVIQVNDPPIADAGPDQTVLTIDTVQLDGSGSSDADGDMLTYLWSVVSGPGGAVVTFSDDSAESPTVAFSATGTYVLQLTASDQSQSDADTVTIDVTAAPQISIANANVTEGDSGTTNLDFTVSLSFALDRIVTVDFATADGTATVADDDYVAGNGTVTFPASTTTPQTISVVVNGDVDVESDETLFVNLSNAGNASIADNQGQGTVENDDSVASVTLTPATLPLLTGGSGDLTVTLSSAAGAGGQVVDLTSSVPAVASVPANVTVTAGNTQATVAVAAGVSEGSAVITASASGFTGDTATVNVSNRNLSITLEGSLVGVGRTIMGTVTLAQPAPAGGIAVSLSSGNPAIATVAPASVPVAEGATQALFTITGVAPGSTSIDAVAAGYDAATDAVQVTNTVINIGTVPNVAPGQSVSLPISISSPAPTGGLTVSLTSADTGIATVTASVFIPEGLQTPAANPQVTGILIGTTDVTATAPGFAPDTRAVTVTLALSFTPNPFALIETSTSNITLNLSAPAPAGGLTIDLSSDDVATATLPAAVVVAQGLTSAQVAVTGEAAGSTTIRANSAGIVEATATINVNSAPPISVSGLAVGDDLQAARSGTLGAPAPAGNVIVTITSDDPARVLLGDTATSPGTATLTRQVNAGGTTVGTFYVQGLDDTGTSTVTLSAPGYATSNFTVTLQPSGFGIWTPGVVNTDVFAPDTTVQIRAILLQPGTLNWQALQGIRGGLTVEVPIAVADPAVGTIAPSPVQFSANQSIVNTFFQPTGQGSTTIDLTQPAGFQVPANINTSINANVTAPNLAFNTSTIDVGDELQAQVCVHLGSAPPAPTDITVTIPGTANALLSPDAVSVGGDSVTFLGVASTTNQCFYVQGIDETTVPVTATATATNFTAATTAISVVPAGFGIWTPGSISTDVFASNTTVQIRAIRLQPGTLNWQSFQGIRGGSTVDVFVTTADTGVGEIVPVPATFTSNQTLINVAFQPNGQGTTTIDLAQPAGFETPANINTQITASVTQPSISFNSSAFSVGDELQMQVCAQFGSAPPTPRDLTVSLPNTDHLRIVGSATPTVEGSATVVFSGVANTGSQCFYVQGVDETVVGTADSPVTLTASATGYLPGTALGSVWPAGFGIWSPASINTNLFATNTGVQLRAVRLQPGTLNWSSFQAIRGLCPAGNPSCGATFSVPTASSNPAVGDWTQNPVAFASNVSIVNSGFDPVIGGTTDLSITQPMGFEAPANINTTIPATVTAPDLLWSNAAAISIGDDLQVQRCVRLGALPPNPVDIVVSVTSGTIATISSDPLVAGITSVTFPGVDTVNNQCFYVQGRNDVGSTTLNAQAAGFNDAPTLDINADPSGFVIYTPASINVDALGTNPQLQLRSMRLDPTTLNWAENQAVRGGLSVDVDVSSTNPLVGRVQPNPSTFVSNVSILFPTFLPLAAGVTNLQVQTPAGFETSSNLTSIPATVTGGFAIPPGQSNLSLVTGTTASASSQFSISYPPSEGIDGLDATGSSWCASASDPAATYTVALGASSTVTTIGVVNAWGASFPIATGRFELYAVGDTPGVDTPQFSSGTLAFSAAGEISYTLPSAQSGVGSVHLVVESTPVYACIGEIGVIGTQP